MTALLILVLVSFLLMLILKASSIGVKHIQQREQRAQSAIHCQCKCTHKKFNEKYMHL
jgi:predicted Holliday junction resolvase-like endonuclease